MLLRPSIKNYPWGHIGTNSLVAQLTSANGPDVNNTRYAELWMGTHPSGPCYLASGQDLNQYIREHPDVLGKHVVAKYDTNFPFLFKVLSVDKALSIQAHPDKTLAKVLYQRDCANYPDDNHKPEMAIAISPFEVLCGFRSLEEISRNIQDVPELGELTGTQGPLESKQDLQGAFNRLMKSDPEVISSQLSKVVSRGNGVPEYDLIGRLNEEFPGDVGIFAVLFLQHFVLAPGEALFLPANEPHAYLSGECMECMANSDNVVRAGLTPKFKDVDVLVNMLTFDTGKEWRMKGKVVEEGRVLYEPPVEEFAVELFQKSNSFLLESPGSCSMCIVLGGNGSLNDTPISKGSVFFLAAGEAHQVEVDDTITLYRAFVPCRLP